MLLGFLTSDCSAKNNVDIYENNNNKLCKFVFANLEKHQFNTYIYFSYFTFI